MASLILAPPKDEHGKPKKIPKVAVYVAGAALAVTTGLTLLVLPFVRQAARMSAAPQFLSHRNLARHAKSLEAASAPIASPQAGMPRPRVVGSQAQAPIRCSAAAPPDVESSSSPDKAFNDAEERALYGALESEQPHEPISPWFGAQALGIATALVLGSAGLGAWGMARVMGVESMEEFTSKMRETLVMRMPALGAALSKEAPPPTAEETAESRPFVALWEEIRRDVAREDEERGGVKGSGEESTRLV